MQSAVIGHGRISRENRRLYRRAVAVEAATIKRNATDIFQIEINHIGSGRVQEAIEGLLQCKLKFSDKTDDFVNSRPVQQASRSIYEQTDVFVKFDSGRQRQFHCSLRLHFIAEIMLPSSPSGNFHVPFRISAWSDAFISPEER